MKRRFRLREERGRRGGGGEGGMVVLKKTDDQMDKLFSCFDENVIAFRRVKKLCEKISRKYSQIV